jgi:hypothetical protein
MHNVDSVGAQMQRSYQQHNDQHLLHSACCWVHTFNTIFHND